MSFIGDVAMLIRAVREGFRAPPFVRPADYPDPLPVIVEAPPAPKPPRASKPVRKVSVPELKRDLLDNLDAYQTYITRLKKADPGAYQTYRRVGAFVLPRNMLSDRLELEPGVLARLPAFGAIAFGRDDVAPIGSDGLPTVPVRFAWMTKLERPGHDVERRAGGTVYRCSCFFDDVKDKKIREKTSGVCGQYLIHVTPDGTITPLRIKKSEEQVIRHRRGVGKARKGANFTVVSHQRWGLPDISDRTDVSRSEAIRELFCLVMNFWAQAAAQSMIRVTATRDRIVMPFVVDVLDTPAFFADRDATVSEDGRKKRIFHIVRGHVRASGAVVKMHFRGLREFVWNSYSIKIVVPGRDAHDIADLGMGMHEDVPDDEMDGLMPFDEIASGMVADAIGSPAP